MANLVITKQTGDYWSFQLDDGSPEILNMRNDLFCIGDECHFKTANGANIISKQDIFPTDVTIVASQTYNPNDVHQLFLVLESEDYFAWFRDGTGGGGVDRFDELLDTFKYTGKHGMCVVVDESQLRLIAVPFYNVSRSTQLSDMPSAIVGGQMVVTNELGTSYAFAPMPNEPETFLNTVGYFIYEDLLTHSIPIPFTAAAKVVITNDGEGDGSDSTQAPFGIAKIWDVDDSSVDLSDLAIGDTFDLRMGLEVTTAAADQKYQIIFKIAIGSPSEREVIAFTESPKNAGVDIQELFFGLAVSSDDIKNFPSQILIVSDGSGSVKVNRFYFRILRKNINLIQIGSEGLELKEDKINKKPVVGNENNPVTYPSTKDVADYVTLHGAADLDAVLTKGDTSDNPMKLIRDATNYFSFFKNDSGFQSLLTFLSDAGGYVNTSQLYQHHLSNIWDIQMSVDTEEDYKSGHIGIRTSGAWLKASFQIKDDGTLIEYMIQAEATSVFIQKRTLISTRQFRIKLDNLTANRIGQMPDGDGVFAYQSYVDGKLAALTTDLVAEGTNQSRLYFAMARVLATLLTGLSTTSGGTVLATDTILQAFGKLQNQITTAVSSPTTIKITTSIDISSGTTDVNLVGQNNKNVIINNANQINYLIFSPLTCTFLKVGSAAIVFQQGSGRTLIFEGNPVTQALLDGVAGSMASLTSDGTVDYLSVTNY